MPLLDDTQVLALRVEVKHCDWCAMQILKNYCRECDEYFEYGHINECRYSEDQKKHAGHRTY